MPIFESPKSVNLIYPSLSTRTFSGLRLNTILVSPRHRKTPRIYLLSIEDVQRMQMLKSEQNISRVKLSSILFEPANLAQVEEKFTTRTVLQTEEEFVFGLEGVVHLDNEFMIDTFLLDVLLVS